MSSKPESFAVSRERLEDLTLRTYAHPWPGDEERTRNVLDAALGPLAARADSLRTEAASEQ